MLAEHVFIIIVVIIVVVVAYIINCRFPYNRWVHKYGSVQQPSSLYLLLTVY